MKNETIGQNIAIQNVPLGAQWCRDTLLDEVVSFIVQNDGRILDICFYGNTDEHRGDVISMDVQLHVELPVNKMEDLIVKYADSRVRIF